MKKILFTLLLSPLFCNAQSIKNLDIKNGFLQFHFGDTITNYTSLLHADRPRKGYYLVSHKAVKLNRYLDKTVLYFPNGILEGIELQVQGDSNIDFMNNALKKAYGDASEIRDTLENRKNYHTNFMIWQGQHVVVIAKKSVFDLMSDARDIHIVYETITFKRANDIKIEGELGPDFPL